MNNHSSATARCSTGIVGLDVVLDGGLPSGYSYLVKGAPGVGKTTVALHFLLEGIARNERVLYVTFSETKKELDEVARSHGWNISGITVADLSLLHKELREGQSMFKAVDVERLTLVKALLAELTQLAPSRVVIDSVAELRLLCNDALVYRHQILELKEAFTENGATALLLEDKIDVKDEEDLEAIAHGAISMEKSTSDFGSESRRLKVRKLRGSDFRAGYHNYHIRKGGLEVFPRLIAAEHPGQFKDSTLSSGIAELDALLGGGVDRGTSNLFSGPTGTGKSTFALKFACEAAAKQEKVQIYSFEESIRTTERRAEALGFGLAPHLKSGAIVIRQIDPGEVSPGEFVHIIRDAVVANGVTVVIIDSLNGYLNAMPDERFLTIQLHELLMFLGQQGVITLLTVAQHGVLNVMGGPIDVSYLADTLIVTRYFEAFGSVKKAISVVKKRSSGHEATIREYRFEKTGIRVGLPLANFQGVLTGTPEFIGSQEEILRPHPARKARKVKRQ